MALLAVVMTPVSRADSARPLGKKTYYSQNGEYSLTVDPGDWQDPLAQTELTFSSRREGDLWRRLPEDFEDFRTPLDVHVSDDGGFFVFGGFSAHNISFDPEYHEGLRIYRADGTLVRFVSRLDLPAGPYGVSTAAWYDEERSELRGDRFFFFTPERADPLVFELATGDLLAGELIPGQGDDSQWRSWWLRQIEERWKAEDPQP